VHFSLFFKNCEKFTKSPFWGVQGRSRSSMLRNLKSPSPVLVMISSMYVPICNHFHATRANSSKITTFSGYPSLTPACTGLLEHRELGLGLLKSTFNVKISYAGYLGLSLAISVQFTLEMCVAAQNHKNS